jgi:hypothetical protein
VDSHHILERRLWNDGGYYVENGASVCEQHHLECEMTIRSVEEVREAAGITHKVIPKHFYDDVVYDKWGNVILPTGQRMKGELFSDTSVQKILEKGNVLDQFVKYYKYPRTYHLPWSPRVNDDDKVISDINIFRDHEVVITEKLDGENFSFYNIIAMHAALMGAIIGVEIGLKIFTAKYVGKFLKGLEFVAKIFMQNTVLHMMHLIHTFMDLVYGMKIHV